MVSNAVPSANLPLDAIPQEALVYCTFSFTIRRDAYHSEQIALMLASRAMLNNFLRQFQTL